MKNRILLLAVAVLLQFNLVNAQSGNHHFALNDFSVDSAVRYIHASTITRDGGMLVLTGNEYRGSISLGDYGFSLIRFDAGGNKLWNTFIYGEAGFSVNYKGIIETPDNGFAIIANTTFNGGGFILKTDASGNFLFMKRYGNQILNYSLDNSDNGFLLVTNAGNTFSGIIKTDSIGEIVWSDARNYSVDPDHYYSARSLANGNYLAVGVAYSNPSVSNAVGIVTCYDATGSILWTQSYQGPEWITSFSDFTELADGSILIAGNASTVGIPGSRSMVTKIDSVGNVQWSKSSPDALTISFYGYTFGDNAIYAAGNYELSPGSSVTLPVIMKLDTAAQMSWLHIYPEPSSVVDVTFGSSAGFTVNQGHLGFNNYRTFCNTDTAVTASCYQYDTAFVMNAVNMTMSTLTPVPATVTSAPVSLTRTNSSAVNFVKFDACLFTGIENAASAIPSDVSVYPNPAKEAFFVNIQNADYAKDLVLVLINNLGQRINQISLHAGTNLIEISEMYSGIYFYSITDGKNIFKTGKMIVE